MTTRLMISAAVAALVAAPALAGGLSEPAETPVVQAAPVIVPAPATDWTGFYAGGSLGTATLDDGSAETDANSLGVFGGYNLDLGAAVVGGELDFSRLTLDTTGDPEADVLRLKGRVGYNAGNVLPYVTAGVAQLDSDDLSLSGESGVLYGIGADFAATPNVIVGAELLQHDFDDAGIDARTFGLRAAYKF